MSGLEIIGAVVAVLQLLGSANKARSSILDICANARNIPQSLQDLSDQIDDMAELLECHVRDSPSNGQLARHCAQRCTALKTMVEDLQRTTHIDGKLGKVRLAAIWKLREKKIVCALRDLERSVLLLNLNVSCQTHAVLLRLANGARPSRGQREQNMKDLKLPPRNWQFVGQEHYLEELRHKLRPSHHGGQHVAVVGLGGIGKTELVLEFVHQIHTKETDTFITFLRGHSELQLELDYGALLSQISPAHGEIPLIERCWQVKNMFEGEGLGKWLMIVDGIDELETLFGQRQLYNLLPRANHGGIVFTCRNLQLALELVHSPEDIIRMSPMGAVDALKIIHGRVECPGHGEEHCLELIDILEGLPLALSQAASFIAINSMNVSDYLHLFKSNEPNQIELLSREASITSGEPNKTVEKTWLVSFQRIENLDAVAARLIKAGSCLWRQQIPVALLAETSSAVRIEQALGLLHAYSLIIIDGARDSFHIHSLVHIAVRNWLRQRGELEEFSEIVFNAIYEVFPTRADSFSNISELTKYSLHAQFVVDNSQGLGCQWRKVELASRLSLYLRAAGDYLASFRYAKTAADWSAFTKDQLNTAKLSILNDLALAYWYLGQLENAESVGRDVLDKRKKELGPKHEDTLSSLSNIGLIVHDRGDYQDAESIHREVLQMRLEVLGSKHNDVMKSRNNLALSLKRQGKYIEAEEILHQVLMERREILGCCHSDTLSTMNNLGLVLQELGRFEEALALHSEVYRTREKLLGSKHPDSLKSKQNIAVTLMRLGQLEEAETMTRYVLAENRDLLGDEHPNTLFAQSNLAITLRSLHQYSAAKTLARQVHESKSKTLGDAHPETIFSKSLVEEIVSEECMTQELD